MKHVRRGGGSGSGAAPGGDAGLIDEADSRDYGPPPVHDDPHATHNPHPTAMLHYVDHDHSAHHEAKPAAHHDSKLSADQQAAIDKALAATQNVTNTVLGIAAEQKVKSSINDAKAVAIGFELATYSRGMSDAASKAFIARLDSLDDPELRHKVMAQFEAQTGQKMDAFIKGCSDWNNNGDRRDKAAALQLISPERDKADAALANMKPEERDAARAQAKADADQLLLLTSKRDHSDENSQKIFRILEKKSPAEMELLRAQMREESIGEHNLYERIDYGMHKGDEDEAVAMLAGDHLSNTRMALINETDPKRFEESIKFLSADERKELKKEPLYSMTLSRINPADRPVIEASIKGDPDLAEGERLGNMLKPKEEGMQTPQLGVYDKDGNENYDRRKAKNVLREFESMSGEQMKAAADAWDKAHPDRPMLKMLEARWGNDDDKTEYLRIKAMIEGDKGKDRSLRLEESMRTEDQDEREAALRHETVDEKALNSSDKATRDHALAVQKENESFERNNVEADHNRREWSNLLTGRHDDTTGHSTKDQLKDYFATQRAKDVKQSYSESMLRADGQLAAADALHAKDRAKHEKSVDELDVAAMELLDNGKLSPATEFRRGKGAKEKAEALENVGSNKELEATAKDYKEKYGEDMLPDPKKDRSDMNANELMIDNVRRYGARAERPAQVEAMLQIQQYEKQKSSSLEADEDGGGTQDYQRILMERQRRMLKDPKYAVHAPQFVDEVNGVKLPFKQIVEDPNEPKFNDIQATIDGMQAKAGGDVHKIDDGLKEGVKKTDFNAVDKQLVAANAAQEEAKKALAERWVKIISTIAKIAAVLTANPWLIAAIDIAEGLVEMGIKAQVMGEAYDAGDDLKMLGITAAADIALLGFSKLGELKGAAKLGEAEALGAAEKVAMETEHAATSEAKSEALRESARAAAGESKAVKGAIEEGGSVEKALASEAEHKVEQKATEVAEGKALHEGESTAAKAAEGAEAATSAEKAAEQIKARYGMIGGAAKMGITTVGGGIVQGKSPSDILKGLVTGGLALMLPGHLAEKVKGAIGNESLAAKVLAEIASFGTEVTTNTTIAVAGGAEGGDALFDSALGAGGGRAQRVFAGHHGAAPVAEEEHASTPVAEEHAPMQEPQNLALAGGVTTPHVAMEPGETAHRLGKNAQAVTERANAALERMDPAVREQHEALLASAETPAHRAMFERAMAAGHSYEEIRELKLAMSNMSEAELVREFSGAGVVQFYMHSCVPTAYQIALAEVDPIYALRLRNNPQEVLQAQREALGATGGAQLQRMDLHKPPSALKGHLDDPTMNAALRDPSTYTTEGTRGIETTKMQGEQLHKQLEAATGASYEVITNDQIPHGTPGAGEFDQHNLPHDRIGAALDAGKPVLFGAPMAGVTHERVFIGREVNDAGEITYIVADPHDGSTMKWSAKMFDIFPAVSITLPAEGQAHAPTGAAHEVGSPTAQTGGAGGERSEPPWNLAATEKAPVRDTRGWSEQYAAPDAPHHGYIQDGRAAVPPALERLVRPEYTEHQQQMLSMLDDRLSEIRQTFERPPPNLREDDFIRLGEEQSRLETSRRNLEQSWDPQRQKQAAENRPRALEMMTQLRDGLYGPESPAATEAAATVPISEAALDSVGARGRSEADLQRDLSDFMRLTGELPNVRLDRTPEERAFYRFGGVGNQSLINVGAQGGPRTITHELSHGLEFDHPEFLDANRSFVESRAKLMTDGAEPTPQSLRELDPGNKSEYSATEMALEGGFANKYTGAQYSDATEVLTTGLQNFISPERMLWLFERDPEHFELVLGMLRATKGR